MPSQSSPAPEPSILRSGYQRLKIDIETCSECGGDVRIIASIEDPVVIRKILTHLDQNASAVATALLPECRAPPVAELREGF